FLLRAIFSLPVLIVPGVCAGAALRRLESRPAGLRLEALQMAILCAGGAFGSVVAGFQLLPWKGETAISLAASVALFATAVLSGLGGGGTQTLRGEAGMDRETSAGPRSGLVLCGIMAVAALGAWERILAQIYGPFPELAPSVLALYLAGCAVGSLGLVFWPLPISRPSRLQLPVLATLTGLALVLTLGALNRLPLLYLAAAAAAPTDS